MTYRGIVLLKEEGHPVRTCCTLLKVSFSGFYTWFKRNLSKRRLEDGELKLKIIKFFGDSNETYGILRIQQSLRRMGFYVGKDRIARLMREEGLKVRIKKSFRPKTTINNPSDRKFPREYKIESHKVTGPNQVWVSDLTYIPTEKEGFVYLVVVMDVFNREIKGWDLSASMRAENTKNALINAIRSTLGKLNLLIFHTDQGIQNCSEVVRGKLRLLGITQSMSRKGYCYDNAHVESFFHTLKNEISKKTFRNLEDVRREVFKYIELWYNRKRLHSSLGYKSPIEYAEAV